MVENLIESLQTFKKIIQQKYVAYFEGGTTRHVWAFLFCNITS